MEENVNRDKEMTEWLATEAGKAAWRRSGWGYRVVTVPAEFILGLKLGPSRPLYSLPRHSCNPSVLSTLHPVLCAYVEALPSGSVARKRPRPVRLRHGITEEELLRLPR